MSQYEVATLKKGLLILDALQQEERLTLKEVMEKFSFNKSTAFRLLYTLESMGYIRKTEHAYHATAKIGGISAPGQAKLNWLSVPPLSELSSEIGETAYVGILSDTDVVTAQVIDGSRSIRAHSEVGDRMPAHHSALGKVILAFLNDSEQRQVLQDIKLNPHTENTFADFHLLKEHLHVIRKQGYAVDDEETEIGLRCIAAPIMYEGKVIAAVAISGPATRLTKKLDKRLSKKLIQCSQQISAIL
ncbi:IclR family transcriptional regulator [Bacillus sp. FJAT-42376]|uniref:IclR family transcriptional regulator n=1 Tax=Bacillus sp. FJAT-42376 TaxID=2014076 RepID=UPI000F4E593F|nr:IclR family transcriptional regulator [Bacillus sp. FJAT-42376]AZB41970.1 IclR family transcriptional regulator [Bacillus sp. FJAT-42376]